MALETVVFQQDPFSSSSSYPYPGGFGLEPDYDTMVTGVKTPGKTVTDVAVLEKRLSGAASWDSSTPMAEWDGGFNNSYPSSENCFGMFPAVERRKRRRPRVVKNKEEVESQRMTHIAVERNRRKQMTEYLTVLKKMIPSSYFQRDDQASTIGGAVNFVKELEQLLQSLKAAQRKEPQINNGTTTNNNLSSSPFADFFTFPQYSTDPTHPTRYGSPTTDVMMGADRRVAATADVEVTMVDAHANVKVLSKKQPKQLLKMVAGLQSLGLSILHLSVTTVDDMALYSFSVKVEDDRQLTSVNEIATNVYEMVCRIRDEAKYS